MKPVNDLYLAYFEPPSAEKFEDLCGKHTTKEGFEMPFTSSVHKIEKDTKKVERLLTKAERIYDLESPPDGLEGCEDCERLSVLIKLDSKSENNAKIYFVI
jgi:hypothetical protein